MPQDAQQALVLDILRRRGGEPVPFAELQAAGIEFPASLVSELELAGFEIERCNSARVGERPVRAVRLASAVGQAPLEEIPDEPPVDPTRGPTDEPPVSPTRGPTDEPPVSPTRGPTDEPPVDPPRGPTVPSSAQDSDAEPPSAESTSGWGPVHVYRSSLESAFAGVWAGRSRGDDDALLAADAPGRRRRGPSTRVLGWLALLVAIAVAAVVILVAVSGAKPHPGLAAHQPARSRASAPAAKGHTRAHAAGGTSVKHRTTSTQRPTTSTSLQALRLPPAPVSPPLASVLETRGHAALAAGQYGSAVPILERAVAATGEHVSTCLEPSTENCLVYAYALFDLGRALLLSGHASWAVPVFEQRLQIDDQRSEVAAQLALARQG